MIYRVFLLFLSLFILGQAYASTFTLQVKKPNHSILLRSRKQFLEFRPNASLHIGFKLSLPAFYIEYGTKLKDTNYGNSEVGNNSYKSYRVGIPIGHTFTELYYQAWTGFSSNENKDSGCDYCLERPLLSSRSRSFHFTYAFDSDFSMRALNSNGGEGVKFSSSWLGMIFGNRLKLRDPGGLLQGDSNLNFPYFARLHTLEMSQAGVGFGYGVLAPFGGLYAGLAGLIGIGYQENDSEFLDGTTSTDSGMGNHWTVKAMLGTEGPGVNIGVKGWLYSNIYQIEEDNNAASLNYSIYLYTSYTW